MRLLNSRHNNFLTLIFELNDNHSYIYEIQQIFEKYSIAVVRQRSDAWEDDAVAIKKTIYRHYYDLDLANISRDDSRGKLFASLYTPSSSYYPKKFSPLDLCTSVLEKQERFHRSAFFRFLSGYCFLFEKACFKCGIQKPNAEHFLLHCPAFDHERAILIEKIRKLLSNHNLALLKIFNKYLIS